MRASTVTGMWRGAPGNGCHVLRRRNRGNPASTPSSTSGERKQQRLGHELAQNPAPRGTERQAQRDLSGAVGGVRSEQAAKVGAGGQQNHHRQAHERRNESVDRGPEAG